MHVSIYLQQLSGRSFLNGSNNSEKNVENIALGTKIKISNL